jgi:copper(I)-binding protein
MPNQKVTLEPGGVHLMFFDMPTPLKAGEEVPVTFTFAKQGDVAYSLPVNAPDAAPGGGH